MLPEQYTGSRRGTQVAERDRWRGVPGGARRPFGGIRGREMQRDTG